MLYSIVNAFSIDHRLIVGCIDRSIQFASIEMEIHCLLWLPRQRIYMIDNERAFIHDVFTLLLMHKIGEELMSSIINHQSMEITRKKKHICESCAVQGSSPIARTRTKPTINNAILWLVQDIADSARGTRNALIVIAASLTILALRAVIELVVMLLWPVLACTSCLCLLLLLMLLQRRCSSSAS